MKGTRLKAKEEFQDEIMEACTECGAEVLKAYWDDELEYYIYLFGDEEEQSEVICETCEALPVASAMA